MPTDRIIIKHPRMVITPRSPQIERRAMLDKYFLIIFQTVPAAVRAVIAGHGKHNDCDAMRRVFVPRTIFYRATMSGYAV